VEAGEQVSICTLQHNATHKVVLFPQINNFCKLLDGNWYSTRAPGECRPGEVLLLCLHMFVFIHFVSEAWQRALLLA
jgi:hypothetical protein